RPRYSAEPAVSPPLCGAGSRSNSPSRAPSTKARHSASVYRSTVSGSSDDLIATAPSGKYAISTRSSCSSVPGALCHSTPEISSAYSSSLSRSLRALTSSL
ncbi:hypothetical protein STRIP9103_07232, partial [Streptomyces ipomoeae 91-03]